MSNKPDAKPSLLPKESVGNLAKPGRVMPGRVELHVHLDGAIRPETAFSLAQEKGYEKFPSDYNEFLKLVKLDDSGVYTLKKFLEPFLIFMPLVIGDVDAIERIAYELCEDEWKHGVCYFETRFCPHLLSNSIDNNIFDVPKGNVTPKMAVEAVLKGLKRGEKDFKLKGRVILSCMRGSPEFSWEVLELCKQFKDKGVVGIDIAGLEGDVESTDPVDIAVFQAAAKEGIHRTVHAGEAGPWTMVKQAVEKMHAERIGHGYHVVENMEYYKELLQRDIHFEVCLVSSHMTGAVEPDWCKHPVLQFAADGANFSLSTDDPGVTHLSVADEYHLAYNELGFNEAMLAGCNFNAARSCFLPEDEKQELLAYMRRIYKVPDV